MPKPKKILIIDDEPDICKMVTEFLFDAGYSASYALNGPDGLAMIKKDLPSLVLLDIGMPGMDGIEVARLAAARHPGLRIMFITGFAAVALAAGDQAPPGSKVLSKPIHLREIVSEVERMMAA